MIAHDLDARMIAHDLDRKLLARTIEIARRTGKLGWRRLQAVLDAAPLAGGRHRGHVDLIGRALSAVVTVALLPPLQIDPREVATRRCLAARTCASFVTKSW